MTSPPPCCDCLRLACSLRSTKSDGRATVRVGSVAHRWQSSVWAPSGACYHDAGALQWQGAACLASSASCLPRIDSNSALRMAGAGGGTPPPERQFTCNRTLRIPTLTLNHERLCTGQTPAGAGGGAPARPDARADRAAGLCDNNGRRRSTPEGCGAPKAAGRRGENRLRGTRRVQGQQAAHRAGGDVGHQRPSRQAGWTGRRCAACRRRSTAARRQFHCRAWPSLCGRWRWARRPRAWGCAALRC